MNRADSILARLETLPVDQRLNEFERVCRGSMWFGVTDEATLLNSYRNEAIKANNIGHECTARTIRLYSYYTSGRIDSLYKTLDANLEFMQQHKLWINYYSCRSLRVEALNQDKRIQSALREARAIYTHAYVHDINYGKGVAAYLIGSCYLSLFRDKDASVFLLEAEKYLSPDKNIGQMHNLYISLWQAMASGTNYDEMLRFSDRWEKMWLDYAKDNNIPLESINPYRINYLLVRANIYLKLDRIDEARSLLIDCVDIGRNLREVGQLMLNKELSNYYEKIGKYDSALHYTTQCIDIQERYGYKLKTIASQQKRARLLSKLGDTDQAVLLYEDLMVTKDSLYRMDLAAQIDDLHYIYKVDELNAQKAKMESLLIFALVGLFGLSFIIVGYIIYRRRLNIKNRLIMEQLRRNKQRDEEYYELLTKMPDKVLNHDELDFRRLTTLLNDPKVLTNSDLKREDVAQMLGINHNQVARLVKANTDGLELIIYINKLRVNYACGIIAKQPQMPVRDLAVASGFNSHTTFIRAFKEFTGMTPGEYKKTLSN